MNTHQTRLLSTICFCFALLQLNAQGKILITEFMANNEVTIADEDGDYSDWIELYNADDVPINLKGWYLTDDAEDLQKWKMPEITLASNGYLLVFASDKGRTDPAGELHTNFKLSSSGEFLAVVEPDGQTISHAFAEEYPEQRKDISYGIYQGQFAYFDEPTPGAENQAGTLSERPEFSHTRGFYDEAFQLTLTSPEAGIRIYYTTDGTRPTPETGTLYNGPIDITTTTPLSAVAVTEDGAISSIMSHTYLFLEDILQQSNNPPGYPDTWSPFKFKEGNAPADYEMDQEIVQHPDYKELMDDALLSIPTVSIVTDRGFIFSHEKNSETGGIYIFTGNSGEGGAGQDWERPASVEYYDPNTQDQFQVNCGLRLHGGNSRVPDNSPKHGFRISFRSQYGPSKLRYPFFEEPTATDEFNALVFRAGYNYSWIKNEEVQRRHAQYLQDPFAKASQRALGQVSPHEKFVHLYLNGLYWGLYNVSEKVTNDFMESYLDGEEEDFDVIKDHGLVVDGLWTDWTKLYQQTKAGLGSNENYQKVQGKDPDGSINPDLDNLLDVENLIGYMQYNMYIGNVDWDHNNWFAARNRVTNDAGFRFFCWDAETSMTELDYNNVDENNEENPSWFYHELLENDDFRMLFADHIQKNFFNGGPLTPEAAEARYEELAAEIDLAVIAESARWGDYQKDVLNNGSGVVYNRNEHWVPRRDELLDEYFPQRTDVVIQQFQDYGVFPTIQAPEFTHYGGEIPDPIDLGMTTNYGDIYFTIDGSDPREQITSAVSSLSQLYDGAFPVNASITVRARAKSGNEWSPITEATFEFTGVVATEEQNGLRISASSFPNPFSGSTTISYQLAESSQVAIDIYTIDGRKIDALYTGFQPQGTHRVQWQPRQEESGIFVYRIRANDYVYIGKMLRKR